MPGVRPDIGEIAQEHINGRTRAEIELILGEEDLAQASI
jgi:hypothetical protein